MAWFSKKADPISDRSRELSAEIAALEAQIRELDSQVQRNQESPENRDSQDNPRLRSTALPHGAVPHRIPEAGRFAVHGEPILRTWI